MGRGTVRLGDMTEALKSESLMGIENNTMVKNVWFIIFCLEI